MSRALEKEVLEALNKGDPRKVFDEILQVFESPEKDGALLEFEFLGKAHLPPPGVFVLRDGKAIGLSKLHVFQAFGVAYQALRRSASADGHLGRALSTEELRRATAILLLSDPEHLTAANCRKRALLQDICDGRDIALCLSQEKYFLDSLLTSRLHRHTKSPTLWSHRRWLLGLFRKHGIAIDVTSDLRQVVFVSGERHPRNYYAWCHARWLLTSLDEKNSEAIVGGIISDVEGWCLKHHDDISGWSFLHHLLGGGWLSKPGQEEACSRVFGSVLRMVESFHWRNESVWWFLHAMVADDLLRHADLSLLRETGGRMFNHLAEGQANTRLARIWFQEFEQQSKGLGS